MMLTRNEIISMMFRTNVKLYRTALENCLELFDKWHEAAEKARELKVRLEAAKEVNDAQAETIGALRQLLAAKGGE